MLILIQGLSRLFKSLLIIIGISIISVFGVLSLTGINLNDLVTVLEVDKSFVKRDFKHNSISVNYNTPSGWSKLNTIDEQAYMAIVISEDWSFFDHPGVDLEQMKQAVADYLISDKRLRGASTISQQLVKNLFTDSERSLQRKIKELVLTMILERTTSKEKILETYLNNVQYGKSLYGITDASDFYFDKSPEDLNVKEGAFLAMLLPNPVRYAISYEQQSLTEFASEKIGNLLFKLKVAKVISEQELQFYSSKFSLFNNFSY